MSAITQVQTDLFGNPVYNWVEKRKANVQKKHEAIRQRFNELYHQQRTRIDDVVTALSEEFYMSTVTIEKILSNRK